MFNEKPKYSINDNTVMLLNDVTYYSGNFEININSGFSFDGATIPKFAQGFLGSPFNKKFLDAALMHDYLCDNDYDDIFSTLIFGEILKENNVNFIKRSIMVSSVFLWNVLLKR